MDPEVLGSTPSPGTMFHTRGGFRHAPDEAKRSGTRPGERVLILPVVMPQTLKGFQDLLPEAMGIREAVLAIIRDTYARFGFQPLDTPVLERLDTLTGATEGETGKQIFTLETPESEAAALRFDLTVPFARVVSQYRDRIRLPFRRCHIGPVFRADKPGPGRFRQFTQCDIDIAGAATVDADAEVIATLCGAFRALGLGGTPPKYRVRVSSRKLVDALLRGYGVTDPATLKHTLRVMDKLQKVGLDNVRLELGPGRVDDSGDPIPGVGLESALIDRIADFVGVTAPDRASMLSLLRDRLPASDLAREASEEMAELDRCLHALGLTEEEVCFDPSLTRGLDYYTGPVLEVVLPDAPEFGSVGGGGRYDGLCDRFLEEPVPATGASIGLDRLVAALTRLGVAPAPTGPIHACVVTVGRVPREEVLRLARELRVQGLNVVTFPGAKKGLGAQLSLADHYGIPAAVVLGEDELAKGLVGVKDLAMGKAIRENIADHEAYRRAGREAQVTVPRNEAAERVRRITAG